MTTSSAPDFMPILSEGAHNRPEQGACIMEYASFLNGETWTDRPLCVHPYIATVARHTNDVLNDEERQGLLALLPRMMGTGNGLRYDTSPFLPEYLAAGDPITHALYNTDREFGSYSIECLTAIIDAYDELTGRTQYTEITADGYVRMAELTAKA